MMEVYLNVAEWGDGVFGAEAAARRHFGRSARELTRRDALLLAASLPNPIERDAGRPSRRLSSLAARLGERVRQAGDLTPCLSGAA
jgi:monofunctional biosynthetic peptidoglycan transglycosylase